MELHSNFYTHIYLDEFNPNDEFKNVSLSRLDIYESLFSVINDYPLLNAEYKTKTSKDKYDSIYDYIDELDPDYIYDWILNNISIKKEVISELKKDDLLSPEMFDHLNEFGNEILEWLKKESIYFRIQYVVKVSPTKTSYVINFINFSDFTFSYI